jgi:ATP:corrinoid adenosyltransferase
MRGAKMNAFAKRCMQVSNQLIDAEHAYMNVYDELNDMLDKGLLTKHEYNRIIDHYFDAGDTLMVTIGTILGILDELEYQKSDHSEEVQK